MLFFRKLIGITPFPIATGPAKSLCSSFLEVPFRYWKAARKSHWSLLFSRLNSPNSLSLPSQERCSSPLTIFVALLWTMCLHSPESQQHPGLHREKCGQQVEGGDSAPLLRSGEAPLGVLCPTLESSVQKRMDLLEWDQRRDNLTVFTCIEVTFEKLTQIFCHVKTAL